MARKSKEWYQIYRGAFHQVHLKAKETIMATVEYPSLPLCPQCGKLHITCTFCSLKLTVDFEDAEKLEIYCPKCSAQLSLRNLSVIKSVENPGLKAVVESLEKAFQSESVSYQPASFWLKRDLGITTSKKSIAERRRIGGRISQIFLERFGSKPKKGSDGTTLVYSENEWLSIRDKVRLCFR